MQDIDVHVHVHVYSCRNVHVHVYVLYVHVHVCSWIYMYVYMYVHVRTCTCTWIFYMCTMYMYMCVHSYRQYYMHMCATHIIHISICTPEYPLPVPPSLHPVSLVLVPIPIHLTPLTVTSVPVELSLITSSISFSQCSKTCVHARMAEWESADVDRADNKLIPCGATPLLSWITIKPRN